MRLVVAELSFSFAVTVAPSRERLSSASVTLKFSMFLDMVISFVSVTKPRHDTLMMFVPCCTLLMVNRPSASATAHWDVLSRTTVAYSTGFPVLLFSTTPLIVHVCAKAQTLIRNSMEKVRIRFIF